jgi:hypothetical protein
MVEEWLREKRELEGEFLRLEASGKAALDPDLLGEDKLKLQRSWFVKFESALHSETNGPLWLKDNGVAEIVSEALRYRDGRIYRLDAYCIMSNHVHVVFSPLLSEATARGLAESARMRNLSRS